MIVCVNRTSFLSCLLHILWHILCSARWNLTNVINYYIKVNWSRFVMYLVQEVKKKTLLFFYLLFIERPRVIPLCYEFIFAKLNAWISCYQNFRWLKKQRTKQERYSNYILYNCFQIHCFYVQNIFWVTKICIFCCLRLKIPSCFYAKRNKFIRIFMLTYHSVMEVKLILF